MKNLHLEKVNQSNKLLANLTKMWKKRTQLSEIRNENGEVTTYMKVIPGYH
jgi:hypothetical protein